ncbi:MAG: hypothetical protein QGH51_03060 [Planctomycetota bacterium]|nr:hypothetical protein [Planctomycetota bacterium]
MYLKLPTGSGNSMHLVLGAEIQRAATLCELQMAHVWLMRTA